MVYLARNIAVERTTHGNSTTARLIDELNGLMLGERAAFLSHCHARGLGMGHVFLMSKIHHHGPIPMTRVAELLGSGLPTATGFISRLEERGLVRRDHDTRDRRVVLVSLTEAGIADIDALHEARQHRMAAAIAQVPPAERKNLLTGIRSLRNALERITEGDETS
jgi:DNA-binding MarR family transcriptional regulator